MKLETFFESFDLLTDAPNAAAKLRELVLQLAVRGKLVEQDDEDEPASSAVQKMISTRKQLVLAKRAKGYTSKDISNEEFGSSIPQGWALVRLGQITDLISGVTKGRKLDNRVTCPYPYLRVANVQQGYLDLQLIKEIEIPVEELGKYKLEAGDILLTEGGDWDKLGRAAIWQDNIPNCIHQNHVFRARLLGSDLLPMWVVMYTNSPSGRQYFQAAAKRTTNLASINMTQLRNCPLPVPPLAEQKRIVEACDRILSLCDQIDETQQRRQSALVKMNEVAIATLLNAQTPDEFDAQWQRLCSNFDLLYSIPEAIPQLRQAILQLAVQGKLVEQDPEENAQILFQSIRSRIEEALQAKSEKKIKFDEIELRNKFALLPKNWVWIRLGSILRSLRYGTSKKCTYAAVGQGVLRIPNVDVVYGRINLEDLKYAELSALEFEELSLQENDLLMIRSNGSQKLVGRTAVISKFEKGLTYAGYLVRLRSFPDMICSDYLQISLNTAFVRDQIEKPIRTTSGVKNINSTEIANLTIPLPPLAEQKRIVAKVDRLMALCDELEAKLTAARALREAMMTAAARQVLTASAR